MLDFDALIPSSHVLTDVAVVCVGALLVWQGHGLLVLLQSCCKLRVGIA